MKNLLPKEKGPTTKNKTKSPEGIKENSRAVMFVLKVLQKTVILNRTYLRCIKLERVHLL